MWFAREFVLEYFATVPSLLVFGVVVAHICLLAYREHIRSQGD